MSGLIFFLFLNDPSKVLRESRRLRQQVVHAADPVVFRAGFLRHGHHGSMVEPSQQRSLARHLGALRQLLHDQQQGSFPLHILQIENAYASLRTP
jgi:hypothetical protein